LTLDTRWESKSLFSVR